LTTKLWGTIKFGFNAKNSKSWIFDVGVKKYVPALRPCGALKRAHRGFGGGGPNDSVGR